LRGWQTAQLRPSKVTSDLRGQECRVYAEGFFAEHVAAQAGLQLLRPANDILASLEPRFLQRRVQSFRAETFERPRERSLSNLLTKSSLPQAFTSDSWTRAPLATRPHFGF
jgi:hypothetical protein